MKADGNVLEKSVVTSEKSNLASRGVENEVAPSNLDLAQQKPTPPHDDIAEQL
jgi:hypothetical protein